MSICIPVYNTCSSDLLDDLKVQLNDLNEVIEVIVGDDCSSNKTTNTKEKCKTHHFKFFENSRNTGSIATRLILAKESKYDWILFLDADMRLPENDFVQKYLEAIPKKTNHLIFGGYSYNTEKINNLRQYYGKAREEVDAYVRQKQPYRYVFSGNFLVHKDVFVKIAQKIPKGYGMDLYFGGLLSKENAYIEHIDNTTRHHGLETNQIFLKKIMQASINLRKVFEESDVDFGHIKLVYTYLFLKKTHTAFFAYFLLKLLKPLLEKALVRLGKPLFFIDLYRLYWFMKNPLK